VVADQDDHRDVSVRKTPYAQRKGPLPGGIGLAMLVNIPGKQGQVHIMV
jgi:hypothetical protein